jgi:hypothetical protein
MPVRRSRRLRPRRVCGATCIALIALGADLMHKSATINLNVLDACYRRGSRKIFYSSSACMYPAYNQEDPLNPKCSEDSAYPAAPTANTDGRSYSASACIWPIVEITGCKRISPDTIISSGRRGPGPEGAKRRPAVEKVPAPKNRNGKHGHAVKRQHGFFAGDARIAVLPAATGAELGAFLKANVAANSHLLTDGFAGYRGDDADLGGHLKPRR